MRHNQQLSLAFVREGRLGFANCYSIPVILELLVFINVKIPKFTDTQGISRP